MDLLSPPSTRSHVPLQSTRHDPNPNHYLGDFPTDMSFCDEDSFAMSRRMGGMRLYSPASSSSVMSDCSPVGRGEGSVAAGGSPAMSSASTVSPRSPRVAQNNTRSRSSSPTKLIMDNQADYSTTSGSDTDTDTSCSSVQQVFIGRTRSDKERRLIAKLNSELGVAATPPPTSTTSSSTKVTTSFLISSSRRIPLSITTRRNVLPNATTIPDHNNNNSSPRIIKKRDSKEFNRRKTLAFSRRETIGLVGGADGVGTVGGDGDEGDENVRTNGSGTSESGQSRRKWEGGFFERVQSKLNETSIPIPSEDILSQTASTGSSSSSLSATSSTSSHITSSSASIESESAHEELPTPIDQDTEELQIGPEESTSLDASTAESPSSPIEVDGSSSSPVQESSGLPSARSHVSSAPNAVEEEESLVRSGDKEEQAGEESVIGVAEKDACDVETIEGVDGVDVPDAWERERDGVSDIVQTSEEIVADATSAGDVLKGVADVSVTEAPSPEEEDDQTEHPVSPILSSSPAKAPGSSSAIASTPIQPESSASSSQTSPSSDTDETDESPLPLPRQRGSPTTRMSARANLRGEEPLGRMALLGAHRQGVYAGPLVESPVAQISMSPGLGDLLEDDARIGGGRALGSPTPARTPSRETTRPLVLGMATPKRMEPLVMFTTTPSHPLLTNSVTRPQHERMLAPGPSRLFKQSTMLSAKVGSTPSRGIGHSPLLGSRVASPTKKAREHEKTEFRRQAISDQLDGLPLKQSIMATPQRAGGPSRGATNHAGMPTPTALRVIPASQPRTQVSANTPARAPPTPTPTKHVLQTGATPSKVLAKAPVSPPQPSPKKVAVSRIPQKQLSSQLPKPVGLGRPGSSLAAPSRIPSDSSLSSSSSARPTAMSGPVRPKPGTMTASTLNSPARRVTAGRPGMSGIGPSMLGTASSTFANSPIRRSPVKRSVGHPLAVPPERPGSSLARKPGSSVATPTRPIVVGRPLAVARPIQPRFATATRPGLGGSRLGAHVAVKAAPRPPAARSAAASIMAGPTVMSSIGTARLRPESPALSESGALPQTTTLAGSDVSGNGTSAPVAPLSQSEGMSLRTPEERAHPSAKASVEDNAAGPSTQHEAPPPPVTTETDAGAGARPRRTTRPVVPPPAATKGKARAAPLSAQTSIDSMSEAQLKAVTARNRARNEVYFSAISKSVVKKEGPRPPSPTIRTIAEREEAERKAGRGTRAQSRTKRSGETTDEEEEVAEKVRVAPTQHVRGPGDEEDYTTPVRQVNKRKSQAPEGEVAAGPAVTKRKRSRATSVVGGKMVRWDKGLTVHSPEVWCTPVKQADVEAKLEAIRSCVKDKGRLELDHLGNLPNAAQPIPNIKRIKVHVAVLCYDGEEPPVVDSAPVGGAPEPAVKPAAKAGGKSRKA